MAFFFKDPQLNTLCKLIPDFQPSPKGGRPPVSKRQALAGIFWILDNGAKWKDLPKTYGSKSSVNRWFSRKVKDGVFETLLQALGRFVEEQGRFRLYECFVDAKGLPVAVTTSSASSHENRLIQELFGIMLTKATPARVIGDKAHNSDPLNAELATHGIDMNAPNRSNRTQTQDGRPLRRYRRRWTVERPIAWLQNYRRVCIRWEKSQLAFQCFLHLARALSSHAGRFWDRF